jgi:hypothetical protein
MRHQLALLARKIGLNYTWTNISSAVLAQLHEICARVPHCQRVFGQWGFDRKLSYGKRVNVFSLVRPGVARPWPRKSSPMNSSLTSTKSTLPES